MVMANPLPNQIAKQWRQVSRAVNDCDDLRRIAFRIVDDEIGKVGEGQKSECLSNQKRPRHANLRMPPDPLRGFGNGIAKGYRRSGAISSNPPSGGDHLSSGARRQPRNGHSAALFLAPSITA